MSDQIQKLERRVADARTREETLRKSLTETEAERDAAIVARRDLLVTGDLSDAKRHAAADRRVADAERKAGALTDAIEVATKQRDQVEGELAQARDRERREAEAAWARERVDQITQALAAFEAAAQPLKAALHEVGSYHGHKLAEHVQAVIGSVKEPDVTGVPVLLRDLRLYALDLLAGRANIQKKISAEDVKAA